LNSCAAGETGKERESKKVLWGKHLNTLILKIRVGRKGPIKAISLEKKERGGGMSPEFQGLNEKEGRRREKEGMFRRLQVVKGKGGEVKSQAYFLGEGKG